MKRTIACLVLCLLAGASHVDASTITTYDPSMMVRTPNDTYAWMTFNWQNFLLLDNWSNIGGAPNPRAFVKWDIDLANLGTIESATIRIQKNNLSQDYGIPTGSHLEFALITQDWNLVAGQDQTPKNYWSSGPSTATPITVTAPADTVFEADITSLMQTWQANPTAYFGIMFRATDSGGGVVDPANPAGGITGDLVMTTTPEPATLALLAMGGLAMLRRRK